MDAKAVAVRVDGTAILLNEKNFLDLKTMDGSEVAEPREIESPHSQNRLCGRIEHDFDTSVRLLAKHLVGVRSVTKWEPVSDYETRIDLTLANKI